MIFRSGMSLKTVPCVVVLLMFTSFPYFSGFPACPFNQTDAVGVKLDVFPVKFFHRVGPNDCYEKCQVHGDCLSVNYHRINNYCELLNQKKSETNIFTPNPNFDYMELETIVDQSDKHCGGVTCDRFSTCVFTISNSICIVTECFAPYPALHNGHLSVRTFSPITATYACNSGYTGVGPVNKITCPPGGTWSAMSYTCFPPVHGGWGGWNSWGNCPVTCGGGYHSRQRSCNNPSPKYGGNNCGGSSNETVACNTDNCATPSPSPD